MSGKVGSVDILPDQMQVINAMLILIFIPIFDKGIYPLCYKFGLLKTPLQKIITGGVLLAMSFVASALVEIELEKTYPNPPLVKKIDGAQMGSVRMSVYNGLPPECTLSLEFTPTGITGAEPFSIEGIVGANNVYFLSYSMLLYQMSRSGETSKTYKDAKDRELLSFILPADTTASLSAVGTISNTNEDAICDYSYPTGGGPMFSITAGEVNHNPIDSQEAIEDVPVTSTNDAFSLFQSTTYFFYPDPNPENSEAVFYQSSHPDEVEKSSDGYPIARYVHSIDKCSA
jgi:hypothetical protein